MVYHQLGAQAECHCHDGGVGAERRQVEFLITRGVAGRGLPDCLVVADSKDVVSREHAQLPGNYAVSAQRPEKVKQRENWPRMAVGNECSTARRTIR